MSHSKTPLKAGLSALTLAGLVAVGCTVSGGAAFAETPQGGASQASTSDPAANPAIAAAQAALAARLASGHAAAGATTAAPPAGTPTPGPTSTTAPTRPAMPAWTRLAGADRYATAVAVAKRAYPAGANTVFIATGANFPDALAAGPVAVAKDAPVLLTQRDSIPSSTLAELKALHPSTVVIVGGTGAVSANVATKIGKLSGVTRVTRIGGADRQATSRLLANFGFGSTGSEFAFVATGANYPDALSAASIAGTLGAPILLVNGAARSVDSATAAQLTKLHVEDAVVVGGPAAVSFGLQRTLPADSGRLSGPDRRGDRGEF